MGIQTIMRSKKILIMANGEGKADIIRDSFFGPITPKVPASVLQLHNDVTLVADEAALVRSLYRSSKRRCEKTEQIEVWNDDYKECRYFYTGSPVCTG